MESTSFVLRRKWALAVVIALAVAAATLFASDPVSAAPPYAYAGAATVVTQTPTGETVVDNGVVFCDPSVSSSGTGGFCIPFSDIAAIGTSLTVNDQTSGTNVSYQVCQDNNGNGLCGDLLGGSCADEIVYSHAGSSYSNPMSGLPTAAPAGCPGSVGFKGLVVFVCTGAHGTHAEAGTTGSATLGSGGTPGFADGGTPEPFCGGTPFSSKAYVAVPDVPGAGPPRATALATGTAVITTGPSSTCGGAGGGLGTPSATPVFGWFGILTAAVSSEGPATLALCVPIGPTGGVGAACGVSTGSGGTGYLNTAVASYTLSDVGWPAQVGNLVPMYGTSSAGGQDGPFTALMQMTASPVACATGNASSFSVVMAMTV